MLSMIFMDEAVIAIDMEVLFISKSLTLTIFILCYSVTKETPLLWWVYLASWIQIQILEYCGIYWD